ncbi:unnamed protein product, partial [Mesorhabditis spiculigera]
MSRHRSKHSKGHKDDRRRGRSRSHKRDHKRSSHNAKHRKRSRRDSSEDLSKRYVATTLGGMILEEKKKNKKKESSGSVSSSSSDDETPVKPSTLEGMEAPSNGFGFMQASKPNAASTSAPAVQPIVLPTPAVFTPNVPPPSMMTMPPPPVIAPQMVPAMMHPAYQAPDNPQMPMHQIPPPPPGYIPMQPYPLAQQSCSKDYGMRPPAAVMASVSCMVPPPPPAGVQLHHQMGAPPAPTHPTIPPPPPGQARFIPPPPPARTQVVRRNRPTVLASSDNLRRIMTDTPWGRGSLDDYVQQMQVGEGTYGQVYKAIHKKSGQTVALKRIRLENEKEGFPITAMREAKILRQINHCNIVRLEDIITEAKDKRELFSKKVAHYLVFEYVHHDLHGLLESGLVNFNEIQAGAVFKQLIEALVYAHDNKIMHRDVKCSNILLTNTGVLKLADLGLARYYNDQDRPYTNRVITLWYRPPELLYGEERYGPNIDVWSAGCILAELFLRRPLFAAQAEGAQIELIQKVHTPRHTFPRTLRRELSFIPKDPLDLIDRMLVMNPKKRPSCVEALRHPFLAKIDLEKVLPLDLPKESCYELSTKKARKEKRAREQALREQQQQQPQSGQGSSRTQTAQQFPPTTSRRPPQTPPTVKPPAGKPSILSMFAQNRSLESIVRCVQQLSTTEAWETLNSCVREGIMKNKPAEKVSPQKQLIDLFNSLHSTRMEKPSVPV